MKSLKMYMVVILMLISSFAFGSNVVNNGDDQTYIDYAKSISYKNANDDVLILDVNRVVKNVVPEDYYSLFLKCTEMPTERETIKFRIHVLAIGTWESGWKVLKSKQNTNGTYDLGYMALNSANISNIKFMNTFKPAEEIYESVKHDNNKLYFAVGIEYYRYLLEKYGPNQAVYCYNGGEYRYRKNTLPKSVYVYKVRVGELIQKYVKQIEMACKERVDAEKEVIRFKVKKVEEDTRRKNINNNVKYMFNKRIFIKRQNSYLDIINEITHVSRKPNPEFVCIGYVKKYGSIVAPIFISNITGKKYIG